jgi:hypothetical protein
MTHDHPADTPHDAESTTLAGAPDRARDLPQPVTFFVTARQRADILRRLRRFDAADRAAALCRALGVPHHPPRTTPPPRTPF